MIAGQVAATRSGAPSLDDSRVREILIADVFETFEWFWKLVLKATPPSATKQVWLTGG